MDTIHRKTTADKVFEVLHDWIASGRYKEGDVLPSQIDLAKQLNVSRNTLREAIFRLTTMGFLETKPGTGTIIKLTNPSNYISHLKEHLTLGPILLKEFIEARLIIEKDIVGMVASRGNQAFLDELEKNISIQKQAISEFNKEAFVKADMDFHLILSKACNNSVIEKMYEATIGLLTKFMMRNYNISKLFSISFQHHQDIYNAIRNKDVTLAKKNIEKHILDTASMGINHYGDVIDLSELYRG